MNSITIDNISITRGNKRIFENFSLTIEKGKITAIIAPSGEGKTTLLDCIAKRLKLDSGHIQSTSDKISYVFQEDRLLPWCTIEKNILLPLENITIKNKEDHVKKYIDFSGLSDKSNSKPTQLSGGEKQRASIARAFAYPSDLLLMDEAFQSLDLPIKFQLLELFQNLVKHDTRTVLFVTHDIREALSIADRIIVFKGSPVNILLDENISHDKQTISESYVHLTKEKLELHEKILTILSQ